WQASGLAGEGTVVGSQDGGFSDRLTRAEKQHIRVCTKRQPETTKNKAGDIAGLVFFLRFGALYLEAPHC
ncbi:hypothetical protein ABTL80_20150, partial [Acinetobacter baumannii]